MQQCEASRMTPCPSLATAVWILLSSLPLCPTIPAEKKQCPLLGLVLY